MFRKMLGRVSLPCCIDPPGTGSSISCSQLDVPRVRIEDDVRVHGLEVTDVTAEQVTVDAILFFFAESDQVCRIEFKRWLHVEGLLVVNLELFLTATQSAARMQLQELFSDLWPLVRAFGSSGHSALNSIK